VNSLARQYRVSPLPPAPSPQEVLTALAAYGWLSLTREMVARPAQALPQWMTIRDASEYSGLSQTLLRRLIDRGTLASVRDGSIKVRRCDVDELSMSSLRTVAQVRRRA